MDDEKVDLLRYLPPYLREYRELRQIMEAESAELQELEQGHRDVVDGCFITSCGQRGMGRFERLLGITPLADDTLETRRFRVMSRWNNLGPYNYAFLDRQLRLLCGEGGYRASLDVAGQTLTVKVELVSKNMLESVRGLLESAVPCNIKLCIGLLYNQHGTLGKFTHRQLASYTHKQLREDVVL